MNEPIDTNTPNRTPANGIAIAAVIFLLTAFESQGPFSTGWLLPTQVAHCQEAKGDEVQSQVTAKYWGHWRGPIGNGLSITAQPPIEFGPSKNLTWQFEIPGRGSGSPIVWGENVFVTSAVPTGKGNELDFKLFCIDRASGKLRWEQSAVTAQPHERTHETNGFASASPCTDGELVYASFGSQGDRKSTRLNSSHSSVSRMPSSA